MCLESLLGYVQTETILVVEWAKCGEGLISVVPTVLWAIGSAALAHRLLTMLFRRFVFRRVPLWEVMLQNLLFVWMVIYSLQFWFVLVRFLKALVDYWYEEDDQSMAFEEEMEGRKLMQQWMIWMCGAAPLVSYLQTRPRAETPPLMIWITTSPWQRREMGPYGYYLNRPLASLQSSTDVPVRQHVMALRRAFSDSKIIIREPPKKKRYSKSV
ncbi:uncharacterized protein LOC128674989 [Plodia interpunctella]|uniref:uncharacterized protein LOC128674989 n=1 Tax=Plodia interpunctella TaxID=58824 RepID=UPI00236762A6|nr:uncharacterized protein LOC128674989 [Plodia interpunctella]